MSTLNFPYNQGSAGVRMNERPILFTPENAQKIVDGQKVQTRRILKPQPFNVIHAHGFVDDQWGYLEQVGPALEEHIDRKSVV